MVMLVQMKLKIMQCNMGKTKMGYDTMRAYLLYLVGTDIFVDKSTTYVDVVYLRYFEDFD